MSHSLGTVAKTSRSFAANLPEAFTNADDALAAAGLNFTVDSVPGSQFVDAPHAGSFHIAVRSSDGAWLGVNSSRFAHYQPALLGQFGETVIRLRPEARFTAGGISRDGRTQFLMVTLDDQPINLGGIDDPGYRNLLFVNGTNGNRMFSCYAVTSRLFCMNQFPTLMKGGHKLFSLGHNFKHASMVGMAMDAVIKAVEMQDEMDIAIRRLLATPAQHDLFLDALGTMPEEPGKGRTIWEQRYSNVMDEYRAAHNANLHGTAWGQVMALQGVDEHFGRVRHGERDAQRLTRMVTNNYPLTNRALELLGV